MIANITSGSGYSGLINYHTEQEKNVTTIKLENTVVEDLQDFGKMLDYHNSKSIVKQPIIHVSLSPDASDQLSDSQLIEIAKDYMKEMGYGEQPTAYVIHNDTNIKHVHCISSRIDIDTGKKINDSYEQYKSQKITRDLELKYKLKIVSNQKSRKNISEEFRIPVRKSKSDSFKTNHIQKALNYIQNNYKTSNEQELKTLLHTYGIKEERGRFWLLDKNNKIISKGVKANFDKNQITNEDLKKGSTKPIKEKIFTALKESGSMDEFKTRLHTQGVFVHEHQNNAGNVFGVSYVDDNNGRVWKSSELSKELSFTKVNESLNNSKKETDKKINQELKNIFKRIEKYKFKTNAEYNTVLKVFGIKEEKGRYFFIDKNDNQISDELEYYFDKQKNINQKIEKGSTKPIKEKIFTALKESGSMDEFKTRLHTQGVFVHEHQNNAGNVFGVSYVDDNNGRVWKSSELSKELSFTKVNSHFESTGRKQNQNTTPEIQTPSQTTEPITTNILNALKGINISGGGDTDQAPQQKRRKKKRKGLGL